MNKEKVLFAGIDSRPILENGVASKDPRILSICISACIHVATSSKIKEIFISLFFSRRQCSKVIFRVTQNSTSVSFEFLPKNLALAESPASYSMLPMVARLMKLFGKPALYLPMVAFVSARPSVATHSNFPNFSLIAYGK